MDIYTLLKAVGDPTRLRILALLTNEELSVGTIESSLQISQANTSKHLKKLSELEIVNKEKIGQTVNYTLNPEYVEKCQIFEPLMTVFKQHEDYQNDFKRLQQIKTN